MRINSNVLGWGVFLIALGAVPLAVERGVVTPEAVRGWWTLWPILLIGGGIALVFRASPIAALAGVVVAGGAGFMLGGAVASGFAGLPVAACGDERGTSALPDASGELADGGSIELELDCGELDVAVGEGSTWRLSGSTDEGAAPGVEAGSDAVVIRPGDDRPGFGFGRARDAWRLSIPSARTSLTLRLNATQSRLDLEGASIDRLTLEANASDVRLDAAAVDELVELDLEVNAGSLAVSLPDRSLAGVISANAGSIKLCVPADVGLRVEIGDNVTASNNFAARGLRRSGDTWETPEFAGAEAQIEIEADANAASIELNPEEGCGG
jgi:hypothetical protein